MQAMLSTAARWLAEADGLLITAGAGMGIDSGLPDFRGPGGFWAAYPALRGARLDFTEIANPAAFERDPTLAWGFYGHRLDRYRQTPPHAGFHLLRNLAQGLPKGAFVFTSNVDGQFQKAGFPTERVCEIHGSIHHLQCLSDCKGRIWSADGFVPQVDTAQCRLRNALPHCPDCGGLARPNILMFGDWGWVERRTAQQQQALAEWLPTVDRLVCIEIGAGTQIPTVRRFSERCGGRLIRLNPNEPDLPAGIEGVALPLGGLAGLMALAGALSPP